MNFEDFKISKQLRYAIDDLGFEKPTPIQVEAFPIIRSGKNVIGISQTGTGKTFAFMLPILQDMKFSNQQDPRVLVLVPTRELALQVTEQIKYFSKYITLRVKAVYGGTNINTQAQEIMQGADVVVATPGRLYDLVLNGALRLKSVKQLVVDEVDVMLDLGFRFQLNNIFELLPDRRQNIMFSATMTDDIETLINDFFIDPEKISIAVSGTPLDNIEQSCYPVENFYTKLNLLSELIKDKDEFSKVLIFTSSKKNADKLYDNLEFKFGNEMVVIHSNKSQNYRIRSIEKFNTNQCRILIATDVIARGLDLDNISHVININVPQFPENYMHRIGRTGRAEKLGKSILFYTKKEIEAKEEIELLMAYEIPIKEFPETVEVSYDLLPEERPTHNQKDPNRNLKESTKGASFHEKKAKNQKVNDRGKYRRELAQKYKKSQTRGDKIQNMKKKKRK